MTSQFKHHRKELAVAKVYFDMYDGYTYDVDRKETDPLVRFHFICAQINELCHRLYIPQRLSLPNGMTIIPTYFPYMEDGRVKKIEVMFDLDINGMDLGRIRDIICAHDSFAIDLGHIIIGSGMPVDQVGFYERGRPLFIEILKVVDIVTHLTWPAWKGTYPLKSGYKGPLLGWGNDPRYTINGIRRTVHEWSEIMGVNPSVVQLELDEGSDIEDALKEATLVHKNPPKTKKPPFHTGPFEKVYTYKGRTATLKEWAFSLDIPPNTLQTRMGRGLTFAEAYEMGGSRKVEIDGEFKYISEWCNIYKINIKKVNKLIQDGLAPADAILTARLRKVEEKAEKERQR